MLEPPQGSFFDSLSVIIIKLTLTLTLAKLLIPFFLFGLQLSLSLCPLFYQHSHIKISTVNAAMGPFSEYLLFIFTSKWGVKRNSGGAGITGLFWILL